MGWVKLPYGLSDQICLLYETPLSPPSSIFFQENKNVITLNLFSMLKHMQKNLFY